MTIVEQEPTPDLGRPLAGMRVVDMSRMVSGPLCGRLLADLGAAVIKVEPPGGDGTRAVPPLVDGVSPYFAQQNAGKRNVSVDLKVPGASEVVARLAVGADVFLENFRPGVLARFGLDWESLRFKNPRLVYCSVTGWGQYGPWMDRRAYAPLIHAETGSLELGGRHRGRRPEHDVNQHADVYAALLATNAVLAALLRRAGTGTGEYLDVAMGQVAMYVNEWSSIGLQDPVDEFARFDSWNHFMFRLGDGSWVALIGDPVVLWPQWAPPLGAGDHLMADPRFATEASRRENVAALVDVIDSLTIRFESFEALEAVLDPWMLVAKVRSTRDLAASDWAGQRQLTEEVRRGLPVPAAPWEASGSTIRVEPFVSAIGGDNRSVLAEAGYDDAEIDALYRSGALREAGQ
jgi:crotonobetainyl-CoA:carnitine CoA-transferase CaiB-like acyl-CoA transferase